MNSYEGKQDEIKNLVIEPRLEVFHNVYPECNTVIRHTQLEFTSVCPKTSLPDFGVITVEFVPRELCLELKSFKLYLNAYRNIGIFMENSVNKIATDVVAAISPKELMVTGTFCPRGGIQTVVTLSYTHESGFQGPVFLEGI